MTSRIPFAIALSGLAACTHVAEFRDAAVINTTLAYGQREMDKTEWEPIDDQDVAGIMVDFYFPSDWYREDRSLGYEFAYFRSKEDQNETVVPSSGIPTKVEIEGKVWEISAGFRLTLHTLDGRLHPYIGAGVAYLEADLDPLKSEDFEDGGDDWSPGVYAHGGAYWDLVGGLHVGIDMRVMTLTDIDLPGPDTDANYFQLAGLLGYSF